MGFTKPVGLPTAGVLLPHLSTLTVLYGGFLFYGTFPKVTLARRYLASCPMELGLSSSPMDSQPSFILASIQFIIASLFVARKCNIIRKRNHSVL